MLSIIIVPDRASNKKTGCNIIKTLHPVAKKWEKTTAAGQGQ